MTGRNDHGDLKVEQAEDNKPARNVNMGTRTINKRRSHALNIRDLYDMSLKKPQARAGAARRMCQVFIIVDVAKHGLKEHKRRQERSSWRTMNKGGAILTCCLCHVHMVRMSTKAWEDFLSQYTADRHTEVALVEDEPHNDLRPSKTWVGG